MIPYLWPKQLENHTLWGRTYLYHPYKGVPPGVDTFTRRHSKFFSQDLQVKFRDNVMLCVSFLNLISSESSGDQSEYFRT